MFSYFDERFTIVDDTLLMYTGNEKEIVIPSSVRGHRIRKIGENALLKNKDVTSVRFEEGIEELGGSILAFCSSLRRIALPSTVKTIGKLNRQPNADEIIISVKISQEGLSALRESSIPTGTGKYLVPPSCLPEDAVRNAAGLGISLTPLLSDTVPLFSEKEFILTVPGNDRNSLRIWQKAGKYNIQSEREGVIREIRHWSNAAVSSAQEADADRYFNIENAKKTLPEKQALAYFTDSDLMPDGWHFLVNLHFVFAYFFRQHVQGVMLGSLYYVYSRYYAFPKGTFRVDISVLNSEGEIVTDGKTVSEIYGKYKLPFVF